MHLTVALDIFGLIANRLRTSSLLLYAILTSAAPGASGLEFSSSFAGHPRAVFRHYLGDPAGER